MKIGLITECYKPVVNGVVFCVENLKRELKKEGHEVTIFAPDYGKKNVKEDGVVHCPSLPLGSTNYQLAFGYPKEIRKILESMDILHTHHPFTMARLALNTKRKKKIPLVFTNHSQYDQYIKYVPLFKDSAKNLLNAYLKNFCNKCDRIIALSTGIAREIKSYGTKTKIDIVNNGIDVKKFQKKFKRPKKYDQIPKDRKIVLHLGRIAHEKNINFLIRSFAKMLIKFPKSHFVIVGSGPALEDTNLLIKKLKIDNNVLVTGPIERELVPSFYQHSDVFASASKTEVHPLVGLEAMASGLPIVTLKSVGYEDIVIHNKTGLFAKEKESDFADKMQMILKNLDLKNTMSKSSRKRSKLFSIQENVRKTLDIYKELTKK